MEGSVLGRCLPVDSGCCEGIEVMTGLLERELKRLEDRKQAVLEHKEMCQVVDELLEEFKDMVGQNPFMSHVPYLVLILPNSPKDLVPVVRSLARRGLRRCGEWTANSDSLQVGFRDPRSEHPNRECLGVLAYFGDKATCKRVQVPVYEIRWRKDCGGQDQKPLAEATENEVPL